MTAAELAEIYPRLFHMAEDGSWRSIREHGLLSTKALLELFDVGPQERRALLNARRPESVLLVHPEHGTAVVRDNKPLSDAKLLRALTGFSIEEWYRLLNEMVFFWLREERLKVLLGARAYRDRSHTVIIVSTQSLLAAHARRVRLSPINSGSTAYRAAPRGPETFRRLSEYPFAERRKSHGRDAIVELAVRDGVADIEQHALSVERWKGDVKVRTLWRP